MAVRLKALEDKYEVLEKIRGGGMGTVYKVRHRLLDEVRVVKVMGAHLTGSEEYRERFAREARTAIKLRHPNTATLYDFCVDDDGAAYMILEFIAGVNLAQLLHTSGPPPVGLLLEIASQSLQAIGYLHRKGLVHRDIAPDNLMLTRSEEGGPLIKLIDLGIVKPMEADTRLTTSGAYLGKLHYSAPEQFGAGDPTKLEIRSDLYSFGVVLYELSTGVCPIQGEGPGAIIAAHLFHGPLTFRKSDPDNQLPSAFKDIVLRAMAREPESRFSSADEFIAAIDELRSSYPVEEDTLEEILGPVEEVEMPAAENETAAKPGAVGVSSAPFGDLDLVQPPPPPEIAGGPLGDLASAEESLDAAEIAGEEKQAPRRATDPAIAKHEEALLEGARKLLDLGHVNEARSQLEVLQKLVPGHPEARLLLAEIEQGGGRQETESMAALVSSIKAHLDRGDTQTAAMLLDSVEGMLGNSQVIRRLRARVEQEISEQQHISEMVDELMASSALLGFEATADASANGPPAVSAPISDQDGLIRTESGIFTPAELARRDREIAAATDSVEGFLREGNLEEAGRALRLAARICGDRKVFRTLQAHIDQEVRARKERSAQVARLLRNAKKSTTCGDHETALSFLEEAATIDPANAEVARLREEAEQVFVEASKQRRQEAEIASGPLLLTQE